MCFCLQQLCFHICLNFQYICHLKCLSKINVNKIKQQKHTWRGSKVINQMILTSFSGNGESLQGLSEMTVPVWADSTATYQLKVVKILTFLGAETKQWQTVICTWNDATTTLPAQRFCFFNDCNKSSCSSSIEMECNSSQWHKQQI